MRGCKKQMPYKLRDFFKQMAVNDFNYTGEYEQKANEKVCDVTFNVLKEYPSFMELSFCFFLKIIFFISDFLSDFDGMKSLFILLYLISLFLHLFFKPIILLIGDNYVYMSKM